MTDILIDDFEDGDIAEWNSPQPGVFVPSTARANSGIYSGEAKFNGSVYNIAWYNFSKPVKEVEIYWNEDSNSFGGGYYLRDSADNPVLGFGTTNPDWIVTDNLTDVLTGGSAPYDTWVRTNVVLDYDAGTADVTFDGGGSTDTGTYSLRNNSLVTEIRHVNIETTGDLSSDFIQDGSSRIVQWTDDLSVAYVTPKAPSDLTATFDGTGINLSWTDNSSDENEFRIYRATSSGSTTADYTQIDTVSANTTTYADTSVSTRDYFYRVTAANSFGESDVSNEATPSLQSISGTVTLNQSATQGVQIVVINTNTDSVAATTTTDSNGDYTVDVPANSAFHIAAQYEDGQGDKYNALSKPFLDT
jgi:hypothetical protein